MNRITYQILGLGLALGAAASARATAFTLGELVQVQEVGVGPHEAATFHSSTLGTITAQTGLLKLLVDGTAFNAFCIDPYQFSNSSNQSYTVADLATAPVPAMGAAAALTVSKLWADFYPTALTDPNVAAGLQIAIWETVAGSNFSVIGSDFGAAAMITAANSLGTGANLLALASPRFQDFVIQPPATVPDGGSTVTLLGLGFLALGILGLKSRWLAG